MHWVLQQQWINGKACLVEEGQLDTLLDILNLPSEDDMQQREEEPMSDGNQGEYLEDVILTEILADEEQAEVAEAEEEVEPAEEALVIEEASQDGEDEAWEEAALEEPEAVELQHEAELQSDDENEQDEDQVITWYYWPNGSLMKG